MLEQQNKAKRSIENSHRQQKARSCVVRVMKNENIKKKDMKGKMKTD